MARPRKTTTATITTSEVKTQSVKDVKKEAELKNVEKENEELKATLKQMQEQMVQMQKMMQAPQVQIVKEVGSSGKKVKLISLMHNEINVATNSDGTGTVKTFEKYGDVRLVKFDDLSDMVSSYPYTFSHGLIYIADSDVVNELGLAEEYAHIYDKKTVDKITRLEDDVDVDMFIGMEKNMRESVAIDMAKKINDGVKYDLNKLRDIKEKCGIDVEEMARNIKTNTQKKTVEE